MPAARRARRPRVEALTDDEWAFLTDAIPRGRTSPELWAMQADSPAFRYSRPSVGESWQMYRADVLREWADANPGYRPSLWWRFDALEPMRRRAGGTGTPAHELLANGLRLFLGVPTDWITAFEVEFYGPKFPGVAVDPADLPTFESQPAFVARHGLLARAEQVRISQAAYEPEPILWLQ